jgi:hypothetical protein
LRNQNTPPAMIGNFATGEFLPATNRTMSFRLTVRDNRPVGGVSYSATTVTAVTSAGPFVITSLNSPVTIAGGTQQTVTWNVAGTNLAPINCANVKISLSTDGGQTFPVVLAASVPNNGSATVTVPNVGTIATTQGRIKVEAIGNIFFDVSDADLTITSTNPAPVLSYLAGFGLFGANAGLLVDYDHDGLANLAEYALGLNPTVAGVSGVPVVSIQKFDNANYLSMMFHRSTAATDLTYTAQASSDLLSWSDLASSVAGGATSGPGFVSETGTAPNLTVQVRDTVAVSGVPGSRRFLRLKISSP